VLDDNLVSRKSSCLAGDFDDISQSTENEKKANQSILLLV
jgi:hypothetical protein